jgi:hypothetical protein
VRGDVVAVAIGILGIAAAVPARGTSGVWAEGTGVWAAAGNWGNHVGAHSQ